MHVAVKLTVYKLINPSLLSLLYILLYRYSFFYFAEERHSKTATQIQRVNIHKNREQNYIRR